MHPPEVKQAALALIAAGHHDCEVSRRTGIPRRTIGEWRHPRYQPQARDICPRCWCPVAPMRFDSADYAALLALYLGDGWISTGPRTDRLRIVMDDRYPGLIERVRALVDGCFVGNRVAVVPGSRGKCSVVSVYSRHLTCLFPQHGPGKKHTRPIALEHWQEAHVSRAPWAFLRGCIWSDGCVFINRTGRYRYESYHFSNRSKAIAGLFFETAKSLGMRPRLSSEARGLHHVRLNRREDVALMLAQVGRKA
jgi:hypothetical protein